MNRLKLILLIASMGIADACFGVRTRPSALPSSSRNTDVIVGVAACNVQHQCVLLRSGTVRCRGVNTHGQLGTGRPMTESFSNTYTEVPGLLDITQLVTSNLHPVSCALSRQGHVYCWGSNQHGMLGVGHRGDEICGLFGQTVPCRSRPAELEGLQGVRKIAASSVSVCAVRGDGTVACWGQPSLLVPQGGELPNTSLRVRDVVDLWPVGLDWVVRLRNGDYRHFTSDGQAELPSSAMIGSTCGAHLCFRLPDATIRCMGHNAYGQLGDGSLQDSYIPIDPGMRSVSSVTTGLNHTCVETSSGETFCWGSSRRGEIGEAGSASIHGAAYGSVHCVVRPVKLGSAPRFVELIAGASSTCGFLNDGLVSCWGTPLGLPGGSDFTIFR